MSTNDKSDARKGKNNGGERPVLKYPKIEGADEQKINRQRDGLPAANLKWRARADQLGRAGGQEEGEGRRLLKADGFETPPKRPLPPLDPRENDIPIQKAIGQEKLKALAAMERAAKLREAEEEARSAARLATRHGDRLADERRGVERDLQNIVQSSPSVLDSLDKEANRFKKLTLRLAQKASLRSSRRDGRRLAPEAYVAGFAHRQTYWERRVNDEAARVSVNHGPDEAFDVRCAAHNTFCNFLERGRARWAQGRLASKLGPIVATSPAASPIAEEVAGELRAELEALDDQILIGVAGLAQRRASYVERLVRNVGNGKPGGEQNHDDNHQNGEDDGSNKDSDEGEEARDDAQDNDVESRKMFIEALAQVFVGFFEDHDEGVEDEGGDEGDDPMMETVDTEQSMTGESPSDEFISNSKSSRTAKTWTPSNESVTGTEPTDEFMSTSKSSRTTKRTSSEVSDDATSSPKRTNVSKSASTDMDATQKSSSVELSMHTAVETVDDVEMEVLDDALHALDEQMFDDDFDDGDGGDVESVDVFVQEEMFDDSIANEHGDNSLVEDSGADGDAEFSVNDWIFDDEDATEEVVESTQDSDALGSDSDDTLDGIEDISLDEESESTPSEDTTMSQESPRRASKRPSPEDVVTDTTQGSRSKRVRVSTFDSRARPNTSRTLWARRSGMSPVRKTPGSGRIRAGPSGRGALG